MEVFLKILEKFLELALGRNVKLLSVWGWLLGEDLWHKEVVSLDRLFAAGRNPEAIAIAVHASGAPESNL